MIDNPQKPKLIIDIFIWNPVRQRSLPQITFNYTFFLD